MMRDLMERLDRVEWNILKRYLIVLVALAFIPLLPVLVVEWYFGTPARYTLSIFVLITSLTTLAAISVALLALKRALVVAVVMVVREIAHTARGPEGEELSTPARAKRGQAAEVSAIETPVRVSKPVAEKVEKKPAATAVAAEKKCPYCGRVLPFGDIHTLCPYCGRRLR